jgi:predicted dehydrogenase
MNRLGVGLIGAGFISKFMVESWKGVRNADITAIYNHNYPRAANLCSYCDSLGMPKPKAYGDLHDLLEDPDVNAVWILTPNFTRIEVMKAIKEEAIQGKNDLVGVCCEKPLARNLEEAEEMMKLVGKTDLLHGYLENQVFSPTITRAKNAVWRHGAATTGRPYIARASEEHGGPHNSWFWDPRLSGGGVLLDMSCHSLEVDRFLLQDPDKPKSSLKPISIQANIESLKWSLKPYIIKLKETYGVDYGEVLAEDYACVNVIYEDDEGQRVLSETKTSWNYVGPGLRLFLEVLGPEYSAVSNSLSTELSIFFSRNVQVPQSEEFIEKQAAEQGLIPIITDEAVAYGYQHENRHMVESFRKGVLPYENWSDGLLIVELMMSAYKSAEDERTIKFNPKDLVNYKPKVSRGVWRN